MRERRIGDFVVQIRGVSYKPTDIKDSSDADAVPLLRANNIQEDGLNFDDLVYVDKKKVNDTQFLRSGDILICSSSGSKNLVGKAAFVKEDLPFTFGAFCKVVRVRHVLPRYLGQYFQSPRYRREIANVAAGININNIRNEHIDNLLLPYHCDDEQAEIADILEKIDGLIAGRRKQLAKLDELVKARFVEMFGDPVINNRRLPSAAMTDVCSIIDGDRGKNYPKQEEFYPVGYCLFLNAKNVTSTGFSFENCMYITEEKDNALHKGKLERGDVVLTTRGTLGNLAFYDESVPFDNVRINSGMVILRMNQNVLSEIFFIEQFKMQLQSIKEKIASGSAQPQLPISTMNNIQIVIAPKSQQQQFAAFVQSTDKSKATVQASIEKLETLKQSLMQEYFG